MQKLTSLLLIGLLFFSNINAISIKKNYLGLSSQKGILSDILNNNIEVSKEQNDEYTKITFIIYHDKPLKDKSEQQVNEIAKSIADYLMGEEEQAIEQLAQQQVPQQVQQAVDDAVEQLQDLAQQQDVTPQQVQQAVQQVVEQLPQEVAQQVQEAVQQLPQQVTPQQVQQIIDQVQQAQQQVAQQPQQQPQQQVPQQVQQAVDDAVEQLQQLDDQDTTVPQQTVQQILQDAAQQLPQQQAQQIQEMIDAVQEQKDDLTPQQVQQIVDELQNNCPDLSELTNAVNDILSKVLDVAKTLEKQKDTFDKFADNSQVLNTNTANEYDDFKSTLDDLDNKLNKLLENVLNAAVTCPFVNEDVQKLQQKVDEVQALIQLYKQH